MEYGKSILVFDKHTHTHTRLKLHFTPLLSLKHPSNYNFLIGEKIKNWKRRWFMLKGHLIYYFSSEFEDPPLGILNLKDSVISDEIKGKKFGFTLKCSKVLLDEIK